MKIHEYQGKEILRRFGIPTPRGIPAVSVDEADVQPATPSPATSTTAATTP